MEFSSEGEKYFMIVALSIYMYVHELRGSLNMNGEKQKERHLKCLTYFYGVVSGMLIKKREQFGESNEC